jgi:hypothetical protein
VAAIIGIRALRGMFARCLTGAVGIVIVDAIAGSSARRHELPLHRYRQLPLMRHQQGSGCLVEVARVVETDRPVGRGIGIGRVVGIAEEIEPQGSAHVPGFLVEFFLLLSGVFCRERKPVLWNVAAHGENPDL